MPSVLKQDINLNAEITFYVKHGDYIAKAGTAGSALFALFLMIGIFKFRL
jgi:apolipoprotein N-acyltransferase